MRCRKPLNGAGGNFAAKLQTGGLHAVANAEDGKVHIEDAGVRLGRALRISAGRPAGEDDADDVVLAEFLRRRVGRKDERVNLILAHPPRDELDVLGPEVEDGDGGLRHREVF